MDLLKTILLYMSMLYISSVQIAPDPSTVDVTPTPAPTAYGIVATVTPVPTPTPTPVPTPDITPNASYDQLIMGDRGDDVKELQTKLQELGYYEGEIDGAYGNQTRTAVELFQYQHGLTVDGIAGMYTQTVLYESDTLIPAPTKGIVTSTPVFYPDATATPPPVTETPPLTETPPVTETPAVTPAPSPEPTDTPVPLPSPDINVPILMDGYDFVLDGFTDSLTAQGTDTVLHPVESDEALYVPLMEILQNAGNIVISNQEGNTEELAFSVLTDLYQVSYTRNEDGSLSGLTLSKNAEPQPMTTRNAILMDGIVYLPLADVERITGIGFTMDDAGGIITVTMPAIG